MENAFIESENEILLKSVRLEISTKDDDNYNDDCSGRLSVTKLALHGKDGK